MCKQYINEMIIKVLILAYGNHCLQLNSIARLMYVITSYSIHYTKLYDPVADGFYFTISYPGFTGEELIEELLYYGISAISLAVITSYSIHYTKLYDVIYRPD